MAETDDDKTERATPRRRQEAREKGQAPQSKELMAALMLASGLLGMIFFGGGMARAVGGLVVRSFEALARLGPGELEREAAAALVFSSAAEAALAMLPILLVMVGAGAVVGYGQVGFQFTPKALASDLSRLDPIRGLTKLLGVRGAVRASLSLVKILAIFVVMAVMAWRQIGHMTTLAGAEPGPLLAGTGHVVLRCLLAGLLAIFVLALIDLVYQRFQHEKELRMSKKEVRDEMKNAEGDPRVKSRIRQAQRELSRRRMMEAVPKATVVITNPTHFAVAVKYDRPGPEDESPPAPRVVAKGADLVAKRIREIASEHGVPCYEDPPLARALHAQVEIGDEIPVELYEAVAAVLAYVYRVQGVAATA